MPSEGGGLLGPLFAGSRADAELTDHAFLQAMLDAEQALAAASARAGIVPEGAAAAIAAACQAGRFDPDDLGRRADGAGNPAVPLVRDLTEQVAAEAGPEAARWVHHGATSQDIMDTAASLVAFRALGPILDALQGAADAAAGLADRHRGTVMAGRTLGQQAPPTTFGLKAAGWLVALEEAAAGLDRVRRTRLAAELGGAAGTLASLGADGVAVASAYAEELGLCEPTLPWHTNRVRVAELAGSLGVAAGALGKIGLDVTLLAQTELGEVSEASGGGRGGSSTLPHKRNPVGAVLVTAATRRAPGLVTTLLAAMAQEQERAIGAWHAEWEPLVELLQLVGSAAPRTRELLAGLEVHPDRMRANLEATGGLLLAERVAGALADALGRIQTNDLVQRLAGQAAGRGQPLHELLLDDPTVRQHLDESAVDRLLDPEGYLGSAQRFVDRALAAHHARPPRPGTAARRGSDRQARRVGADPGSPSPGSRRPRARLAFALSGPEQSSVLVLANSMGTTPAMWDPQLPALAGRLRVLRYDHRGHGLRGADRPLHHGAARRRPARPDRRPRPGAGVVLRAVAGWDGRHVAGRPRPRPHRTARPVLHRGQGRRRGLPGAGGQGPGRRHPFRRRRRRGPLVHPHIPPGRPRPGGAGSGHAAGQPAEGYAGCCEALAAMDLRPGLANVTAPTLVLAGADDPATPPAQAGAIVAAIPTARLEVVADAAHLANIEQPEQVTRLLLDHFIDLSAIWSGAAQQAPR